MWRAIFKLRPPGIVPKRHLSIVMPELFPAAKTEEKWQKRWEDSGFGEPEAQGTDPFYCLSMFPYPSGRLHLGHMRVYTMSDVVARYHRLKGKKVVHPIGWDSFGLPAENAARERNVPAAKWTVDNIMDMRLQLKALGIAFDWDREIFTSDPSYYKWTQWLFIKLFEKGLAYRKESFVNWDPIDETVLADEQVDSEGRSWRSGAVVERRLQSQWFFRITEYADELLRELHVGLQDWPSAVKNLQTNWIGRSEGVQVKFCLAYTSEEAASHDLPQSLNVFTTRPDTLFGVSYIAIAPEHPIASQLLSSEQNIQRRSAQEVGMHPMGKKLSGLQAVHPLTGEELPVYVADYVLNDYAEGAVMGVPAHDERDSRFAIENGIPIVKVIEDRKGRSGSATSVFTGEGILVNSERFSGMTSSDAKIEIARTLVDRSLGTKTIQYRLRDWSVSRQRYWGTPIPIVYCKDCGPVPVPVSDLPVQSPAFRLWDTDTRIQNRIADLRGHSPNAVDDSAGTITSAGDINAELENWSTQCTCPSCGGTETKRETETLDTFVDSSWYYLRFLDPYNAASIADFDVAKGMSPAGVDLYIGGIEHAILHLLYARFISRFLHDEGASPFAEPFKKLLTQGLVTSMSYRRETDGKYIPADMVESRDGEYFCETTGAKLVTTVEKMSKSKYNGKDPADVTAQYGVDVTRLFLLFKAPPERHLEWDESAIAGQSRWLQRVWTLVRDFAMLETSGDAPLQDPNSDLVVAYHKCIQSVSRSIEASQTFNVAIAELMKLSNVLHDSVRSSTVKTQAIGDSLRGLCVMLAPFAPHFAAEVWEQLSTMDGLECEGTVHDQQWPVYDSALLEIDDVEMAVQVMGRVRGTVSIPRRNASDQEFVVNAVMGSSIGQKWLQGHSVKRIILPRNRNIVNFVIDKSA